MTLATRGTGSSHTRPFTRSTTLCNYVRADSWGIAGLFRFFTTGDDEIGHNGPSIFGFLGFIVGLILGTLAGAATSKEWPPERVGPMAQLGGVGSMVPPARVLSF